MPPESDAPEYTAGLIVLDEARSVIVVVKAPAINADVAYKEAMEHITEKYSVFGYISLSTGYYIYIPPAVKVLAITLDTVYADYAGLVYYLSLTDKGVRKGFRQSQKTFESFMTVQPPTPLNKLRSVPETEPAPTTTLVESLVDRIKYTVKRNESTNALEWAKVLEIVIQRGIS